MENHDLIDKMARLDEQLKAVEKRCENLHERVGGGGSWREKGLESRVQKMQDDIDRIGVEMRSIRATITGNGGGESMSLVFYKINGRIDETHKSITEIRDFMKSNPSIVWLLRNKPIPTIAVGISAWILIATLYNLGLLPLLAKAFGFSLP